MRNDILNSNLSIEIKMNYYYDRPFYFISINDEKKSMLKLTKYISENRRKINKIPSPSANYFRQGSCKFRKNLANCVSLRKESDDNDKNSITSSFYFDSQKKVNEKKGVENQKNLDKNEVLENIDKYKERINKDQFILFIKLMLFVIITGILIIYILNMILQRSHINMTEKIFNLLLQRQNQKYNIKYIF